MKNHENLMKNHFKVSSAPDKTTTESKKSKKIETFREFFWILLNRFEINRILV